MNRMIFAALLLIPMLASAEIFKWVDESGAVHFGDRPPQQKKIEQVEVKPNTYSGVHPESSPVSTKHEAVSKKKVVMYSTEWCGHCKRARRYFKEHRIAFKEYDVEKDRNGKRKYEELGASGVPIIFIGKSRMNGFSEQGFERLYSQ